MNIYSSPTEMRDVVTKDESVLWAVFFGIGALMTYGNYDSPYAASWWIYVDYAHTIYWYLMWYYLIIVFFPKPIFNFFLCGPIINFTVLYIARAAMFVLSVVTVITIVQSVLTVFNRISDIAHGKN